MKKDKHSEYECPDCKNINLIVIEETAFYLNGTGVYCHIVKAHDGEAKVECLYCDWKGALSDVISNS